MKKIFIIFTFLFGVISLFSQEVSIYTTNGNSYILNKQENTFVLSLTSGPNTNVLNFVKNKVEHIYTSCEILNDRFLKIVSLTGEIDSALRYINGLADYSYSHLLLANNDILKWTYNRLFVKVKENVSIESLLQTNNVSYVNYQQFSPDQNVYLIYLTTGEDKSISVSNQLYETGYVIFAQPDFWTMSEFVMSSDLFPYQWNLNNTRQLDTFVGIDIDAVRAWNLATGTNVNVAVVDEGVDLNHPELSNNLFSVGYDATGVMPNGNCSNNDAHGTACAGIIAAENNNDGVTGIAYDSKIVPVRIAYTALNGSAITSDSIIASGIDYASNYAAVLNNSWDFESFLYSQVVRNSISYACKYGRNNFGCVVVFPTGNRGISYFSYSDPLFDSLIFVGAISPCGERKSSSSCDGDNSWESSYGSSLSVVAPGVAIPTTDIQGHNGYNYNYANASYLSVNYGEIFGQDYDYTSRFSGTSAAAAHVSGVAALILSINPNLTAAEVKRIIEKSARKIRTDRYPYTPDAIHPNGSWNDEMGYGLVDAYAAVRATAGYDLYTRDNEYDNLNEPNTGLLSNIFYSPDIWVRKYRDTVTRSQTITIAGTNYVFVRVHNNGPVPSLAHNDSVRIFAKANISSTLGQWDNSWLELGATEIPEIPAGRDTIVCVKVEFPPIGSAVDFAIYSRIESIADPLAFSETNNADTNVRKNNNISAINVKVLDHYVADNREANFTISKISNNANGWEDIRIRFGNQSQDSTILDFADITLELSDDLMYYWQDYMDIDGVKHIKDNEYFVTERSVTLPHIPNSTGEYSVTIKYNFLTNKVTMRDFFNTYVLQYKNDIDEQDVLIGGFTIQVEKPKRTVANRFHANAGNDTAILIGTNAVLHATQINEDATYRWYDKQRNFKYEGLNYTVTPSETNEYILEVTAESDGYRDLDTVKVNVVPGCIRSITPNPVSDNWVTVSYEYATMVTSAHLYIYNTGTTTLVGSYDLSNLGNVSSLDVEVTNYPTGSYTVVLVCDNAVCHSKVLIRQ